MKKLIAAIFSVILFPLFSEEDPGLLFKLKFDAYNVTADTAKGEAKSRNFKADLQLRMHPGIDGKGNALKLNGKEFCAYAMPRNFDTKMGTVNLWVSPQNWKFSEKRNQVFFEAKQADFRLVIYKYEPNPYVCAYLQGDGSETANARIELADWENKQWHMITVTWDSDALRLYIDGRLPKNYAPGDVHPAFPVKKFSKTKNFPPVSGNGVIGLGNLYGGFRTSVEDETALDELFIYNRSLSDSEILALYEAKRPPKAESLKPAVLTIPKTAAPITLDGKINEDEWKDAAEVPFMQAYKIANHLLPSDTRMRAKTDGKNLYLGFTTDLKNTRRQFSQNDADLYNDDVFEFFILDREKHELWFCVNANGAVFDARDGKREWNSGARAAGNVTEHGWSAEMAIPLSSLGNPAPGEKFLANFHTLNFSKAPNFYWSWNGNPQDKAGISSVVFSDNADCVSIENLGDVFKGKLDAEIRSSKPVSVTVNGEKVARKNGRFTRELPAGKYRLEITENGSFAYSLDFFVNFPLTASYKSYPSRGFIEVKSELGNAGSQVLNHLGEYRGKVVFLRDGRVVSEQEFKPETVTYVKLPLPKDPEPGTYEIKVVVSGKKNLETVVPFRVPPREPYQLKIADDHTVPSPWMKVTDKGGGSFGMLDRTYVFNASPFPEKMISRGRDVLASQPVLEVNGENVLWSAFKVDRKFDDYIAMSGTGTCAGLEFRWNGELWFDGLWKLDFTMSPETRKQIDSMRLTWKVPAESARYFMSRWKDGYVTVPWKDGRIESPLNIADASWLTGVETGCAWLPLSSANWVSGSEKALVLKQSGKVVDVALNIIAKDSTLTKPAKYSIAFIATPSKRPPENFRTVNSGSYMDNKYQNLQVSSTEQGTKRGDEIKGYASLIPLYPDRFRKEWIAPYLAKGVRLTPYHQPKGISLFDPEWDYALAEWKTTPGYTQANLKQNGVVFDFVHCCGDGIADLMAYRIDKLYKDYPELGGIYYDICDVGTCGNTAHGHGGIDAFGQNYSDSTALSLRNYLMRIYKVSHKHGKIVFNHAHNYFNPVAHNFTDYWYPGENEVWLYGNNPDYYYSEAPLIEYQAAWSPVIRGSAIIRSNQVSRVLFMDKLKSRRTELNSEKMAVRSFASALLHDFNIDSDWINHRAVQKFWGIRNGLNLNEAVFHGYWFDSSVRSKSPGVYVSWYDLKNAPYKKLLIVGNLSRKDQPAALETKMFDGVSEVMELWSGKKYKTAELNSLSVPENGFLLLAF